MTDADNDDPHTVLQALAATYALVFVVSAAQLARIWRTTSSWTTQRSLHALVAASSAVRCAFDVLAARWWKVPGGLRTENIVQHEAFYVLDLLPGALLFNVFMLLVLFWADVYYTAADQSRVYKRRVWPAVVALQGSAYLGAAVVLVRYATDWRHSTEYAKDQYAVFQVVLFGVGGVLLAYYGWRAFSELQQVPVGLRLRASKLREVAITTATCTLCFIARALVVLWAAVDAKADLDNASAFKYIALFFALSEVFPSVVVLWFFRKLPRRPPPGARQRPVRDAYAYRAMREEPPPTSHSIQRPATPPRKP